MSKIGRNEPCTCGSGKKYKKCCLAEDTARRTPIDTVKHMNEKLNFLRKLTYTKIPYPSNEEMNEAMPYKGDDRTSVEAGENILAIRKLISEYKSDALADGKTEFTFDEVRKDPNLSYANDGFIGTEQGYAYVYDGKIGDVSAYSIFSDIIQKDDEWYIENVRNEGECYYDVDKNEIVINKIDLVEE